MLFQRDSPPFSNLVLWFQKQDLKHLREFFPLISPGTWIRVEHKKYYSKINLEKLITEIKAGLIGPLFIRKSINIKDEDEPSRHKKTNLFSLFEIFYRDLKEGSKDLEEIVRLFGQDLKGIIPGIQNPFFWILEESDNKTQYQFRKEMNALTEKIDSTWAALNKLSEESHQGAFQDWRRYLDERDALFLAERHAQPLDAKRILAIESVERMLAYLKFARGKPGRHPKPFNVLIYHLINKCTRWKVDKNRNYIYRMDGQHLLKRDWKLILYLLLYIHFHVKELHEVNGFILKNRRKPAHRALKALKGRLLDIYKNFPPKDGWPFQRKILETGFRKLTIDDGGRLQIVRL